MNFGNKIGVSSIPLTLDSIENLYPESEQHNSQNEATFLYKKEAENIVSLFKDEIGQSDKTFRCFITKKAMDAFVAFANEIHQKNRNEATGIIVGYYFHDENQPDKKIIVGTNFLQATGSASSVTCEFSFQDSIRHSQHCDKFKVLPIIWIHSHPGFGVFYSQTDRSTLKGYFPCAHQMGVVVDNIQNQYLGFKIYNGKQQVEDIYIFDMDMCMKEKKLSYQNVSYRHYEQSQNSPEKKKAVSFKDLSDTPKVTEQKFQFHYNKLNELSTQLSNIEKSDSFNLFIKSVSDLGKLVQSLKSLSSKQNYSFSNFSAKDMEKEIVSQIKDVIYLIEEYYREIKKEINAIAKIENEIENLKRYLIETKQTIEKIDNSNDSIINKLNDLTIFINSQNDKTVLIAPTSHSKHRFMIFIKKNISIILSTLLLISLIFNILLLLI